MNNDPQPTAPIKLVRSLTEVSVEEAIYKPDLAITDRYQNFSTELLRASLLGIGVFGFLLKEVILNKEHYASYLQTFLDNKEWFVGGLGALAVSAAFALAHRYVSSDCIAYQIRYLRLKTVRDHAAKEDPASEAARKRNEEMQDEKDSLEFCLKAGAHTLLLSAVALGLGIALMAVGISKTIFSPRLTQIVAKPTAAAPVPTPAATRR